MSKTKALRLKQALRKSKASPAELQESAGVDRADLTRHIREGDATESSMRRMAPQLGVDARWLAKGHRDPEADIPEWDHEGQAVRDKRFQCGGDGCSLDAKKSQG